MIKFVTNVYSEMLRQYIDKQLEGSVGADNTEQYLNTLSELYHGTTQLSNNLAEKLKLGGDTTFLVTLTKVLLFGKYLETYIRWVSWTALFCFIFVGSALTSILKDKDHSGNKKCINHASDHH